MLKMALTRSKTSKFCLICKHQFQNLLKLSMYIFIIFGLLVLINVLIYFASSKLLFKFCKKLAFSDKSSLVTKDGSREDGLAVVQHEGQYLLEPWSHPLHPCVRNSAIQRGEKVQNGVKTADSPGKLHLLSCHSCLIKSNHISYFYKTIA